MTTSSQTTELERRPLGCGGMAALIALLALGLLAPLVVQFAVVNVVWYGDISTLPFDPRAVLALSYIHPVLVLVAALGLLSRNTLIKAVAQTLLISAVVAALLLAPRVLLGGQAVYASALARTLITLISAAPLLLLARRRGAVLNTGGLPVAVLIVGLFALPWVRLGALGDVIDIISAAAQAVSLGLLASGLACGVLMPALRDRSPGTQLGLGGLALAAALVGIGGAWGQDDVQAYMMPAMLAVAFGAAGLAIPDRLGRSNLAAPFLLVAGTAFLPLAFADPEEIALVVSLSDDTAKFTQQAAWWMVLIGFVIWAVLQFRARALPSALPPAIASGAALLALIGAGALYATDGQAGFYGNHFFVILRDQADVSQAASMADLKQRRQFVYATLVQHADQTQAGIRRLLDQRGVRYTPFYLVNAVEVEGDVLLRQQIAAMPEVDRVIFSQALRPLPEPLPVEAGNDSAPTGVAWGVHTIGADRVWSELGVRGDGIVVGQSDSGVDWNHPALRDSYRGRNGDHTYNWYDPWTGRAEPWDGNGHGTHTIATVLGANGVGVAPGATWFGCANLVRNIGNPPDYLRCMQFMLAPFPQTGDALHDGDPSRAADISTNSWGCPPIEGCDDTALAPAVKALRAAGVFFVVAAGNDGPLCGSLRTPPGDDAQAISVGAIDLSGDLARFSSRGVDGNGRTPLILAPGVDVLSAWPGGGYNTISGTSMATPHVAGVVALMWSANPALRGNVDATEQMLIDSAAPYSGQLAGCGNPDDLPNAESGYGVVDAFRAVQLAQAWK